MLPSPATIVSEMPEEFSAHVPAMLCLSEASKIYPAVLSAAAAEYEQITAAMPTRNAVKSFFGLNPVMLNAVIFFIIISIPTFFFRASRGADF